MATSPHWPAYLPRTLVRPQTTLWFNLEVTAARFPERSATAFFGRELRYRELKQAAERFAGWLASRAGVAPGERVAIYLQNSPQWLISYYGTLRAGAVVVPINPMLRAPELRKQLDDSAARVLVCAQ
ncbi:MAG TPA: AMP-binding protein, partial [Burkholderiaceae bacterium]|nr:AMP-binding protein [Burkholderiaceae bacterium]